jgi:hypothetical protein
LVVLVVLLASQLVLATLVLVAHSAFRQVIRQLQQAQAVP